MGNWVYYINIKLPSLGAWGYGITRRKVRIRRIKEANCA